LEEERKGFVTIVITNTLMAISGEKKLFHVHCAEEEEKDQETLKEEYIHQEPTP